MYVYSVYVYIHNCEYSLHAINMMPLVPPQSMYNLQRHSFLSFLETCYNRDSFYILKNTVAVVELMYVRMYVCIHRFLTVTHISVRTKVSTYIHRGYNELQSLTSKANSFTQMKRTLLFLGLPVKSHTVPPDIDISWYG